MLHLTINDNRLAYIEIPNMPSAGYEQFEEEGGAQEKTVELSFYKNRANWYQWRTLTRMFASEIFGTGSMVMMGLLTRSTGGPVLHMALSCGLSMFLLMAALMHVR
ncbi:unnamed protein product [Owenia fusiformis]|uniref:Uncharacterized protein n=1 Tax=Owenia fusiformis TaxID=6347 RepID=A0A8J1XYF4_OWEFU|nr:unnamed protein product [Owenia fusiformis]